MVKSENQLCACDFSEDPPVKQPSPCRVSGKSSRTKVRAFRNPFFNFLADFRRENSNLKATQIASRGAERWRNMSKDEKTPYWEMAKKAPKTRRRARKQKHIKKKYSRPKYNTNSRGSSRGSSGSTSGDC